MKKNRLIVGIAAFGAFAGSAQAQFKGIREVPAKLALPGLAGPAAIIPAAATLNAAMPVVIKDGGALTVQAAAPASTLGQLAETARLIQAVPGNSPQQTAVELGTLFENSGNGSSARPTEVAAATPLTAHDLRGVYWAENPQMLIELVLVGNGEYVVRIGNLQEHTPPYLGQWTYKDGKVTGEHSVEGEQIRIEIDFSAVRRETLDSAKLALRISVQGQTGSFNLSRQGELFFERDQAFRDLVQRQMQQELESLKNALIARLIHPFVPLQGVNVRGVKVEAGKVVVLVDKASDIPAARAAVKEIAPDSADLVDYQAKAAELKP